MSPNSLSISRYLSGLLLFLHLQFIAALALPSRNANTLAQVKIRQIQPKPSPFPPLPHHTLVNRDPNAPATVAGLPCPIDTGCYFANTAGKLVCKRSDISILVSLNNALATEAAVAGSPQRQQQTETSTFQNSGASRVREMALLHNIFISMGDPQKF
ncbi:predicted protein [Histoplasma capsulatum H143]|uniref:Uncharacterized protein n=1 Tax=Ajellomyces capsulatus (strain H143) TaxID=544712 RepID=C6HDT2_AJECH|nr:predicted protein [Histoplasma capsulatum H143]